MARVRIEPRCARGHNVFISSEGLLLPCCYAHILLRRTIAAPERVRAPDDWFYRHREAFDLTRRPLAEVAADPVWEELRRMWAEDRAPEICYRYCGLPADAAASVDDVRRGDRMALRLEASPRPARGSARAGKAQSTRRPGAKDRTAGPPSRRARD
jgi:hypothetical protein